ncbi:zinc uptake protein ZrgA [Photobacterium sp. J15]|uniref:zinc uptake protein ZrgA n=1 Tax=Photobacterium sp. J15 TaxID=265901 RepID=UPI0007E4AF9B|nr:DUF2796 domain-containing protein [Photobacterium sp. J15]
MPFPYRLSHCALLIGAATLSATAIAEADFRQHDAHVHGVVEFNIAQDGQDLLMEITAPGADVVGFEHAPTNKQQHQALDNAIKQLNNANALFAFTKAAGCKLTDTNVTETLTAHHDDHDEHDHEAHDHDHHDEHDHEAHDHDHHDEHDHEAHDHDHHDEHDHEAHDHDHHDEHDHEAHDHDHHDEHDHEAHDHDHHDEHDHEAHDHDHHDEHDHEAHDHDHHDEHDHEAHDHDHHDGHNHDEHEGQHGEFSAQYTFSCDNISQLKELEVNWFKHFPNTEKVMVQAITDNSQQAAELSSANTLFKF